MPCAAWQLRLLLAAVLLLALPGLGCCWPFWRGPKKPDISSAARCREASRGHTWKGDTIWPQLQSFFDINGPSLTLPTGMTDITTAATIIQLAVPDLKLVLDPLLFLRLHPTAPGIPRLVHMTLKAKHHLAPHQILSIISWGRFNHGWAVLLYDHEDITSYMRRFYPSFMPTYNQLKSPIEKSDAWRYHVLCGHGGIYADTDTVCAAPFSAWLGGPAGPAATINASDGSSTSDAAAGGPAGADSPVEPGLIVGIENRFHSQAEAEEASYVHKIQITQWTMASKRSHPVVCRMGAAIKAFVEDEAARGGEAEQQHGHDAAILLRTGPGIWSQEIHTYMRQMGSEPEQLVDGGSVADLVVLPQAAFGCNFRYWNTLNNRSLVYHAFNNSWKQDHYKVADAKRQERRKREAAARRRQLLQHPALLGLVAGCCVLTSLYAALRLVSPAQLAAWLGRGPALRRRRRPHALMVAGGSPRSSPRSSPRLGGSPRLGAGSARSTSSQQRGASASAALLGTRKVGRWE